MTLLIKAAHVRYQKSDVSHGESRQAEDSRRLPDPCGDAIPPSDAALRLMKQTVELDSLRARLTSLEQDSVEQIRQAQHESALAYEKGLADGIATERARVVEETVTREAALRDGVEAALGLFAEQLRALEMLSSDIALAALERVLGEPSEYATLVTRTARHHLAQLVAGSVVAVEVSDQDFPTDLDASKALAACVEPGTDIRSTPSLRPGACRIRLNLGTLDAGLDGQLARIRSVLNEASA